MPAYTVPAPEEWATMDMSEIAKQAYRGGTLQSTMSQLEMTRRLIVALGESKQASDRGARRLLVATWVMGILTAALIVLGVVAERKSPSRTSG